MFITIYIIINVPGHNMSTVYWVIDESISLPELYRGQMTAGTPWTRQCQVK